MYMYRFATNIGYLLYPYSKEENISDTDIIDYEIDNDKDCHLYKIRLIIPECGNNYSEFKTNIAENEQVFINNLQKYIK